MGLVVSRVGDAVLAAVGKAEAGRAGCWGKSFMVVDQLNNSRNRAAGHISQLSV